MASKAILVVVLFSSVVSMILSHPQQFHILPVPNPPEPEVNVQVPQQAQEVPIENLPLLQPRTFGSLFNLSAYLQNAPTNGSALNFVPLITLLTAKG